MLKKFFMVSALCSSLSAHALISCNYTGGSNGGCPKGGTCVRVYGAAPSTQFPYQTYSGYCSYARLPNYGDDPVRTEEFQNSIRFLEINGYTVTEPTVENNETLDVKVEERE